MSSQDGKKVTEGYGQTADPVKEGMVDMCAVQQLDPIRVTHGPKHHFFGYYDKQQWDPGERYLLTMGVDFIDRSPRRDDAAAIGVIDLKSNNELTCIGTTRAWCWQQGAMLQWIPGTPAEEPLLVYNDRIGDRFVAVVYNLNTGEHRTLPRPVYTLSNDGRRALSLNFSRNALTRPGYGYNGLCDLWHDQDHPAEDGIYLMDMESGNHRLIVSIDQLANHEADPTMEGARHWVNHLLFSPDDSRFIFLHRWSPPGKQGFSTRVFTANPDGTDLHLANLDNGSHFIWYDDKTLLIWTSTPQDGPAYYLYEDRSLDPKPFGKGVLLRDGHCSVSPDRKWVLTDEYPGAGNCRPLILYNPDTGERTDIGRFYSPPELTGEIRCDLHPRWSPSGRYVCIDSVHEDMRQMYIIDVTPVTKS